MIREERKSDIECGVVLHTTKFGEGQMVVHMLTRSHSRRSYIARLSGKRGEARRLLGPLSIVEFNASVGRGDLGKMSDIVAAPALYNIHEDIAKCTLALFVAELLYRVARTEGETDGQLFEFTSSSILELEAIQDKRVVADFHLRFMVQLASHLGYAPRMNWGHGMCFDIKAGEFTHQAPPHGLVFDERNAEILYRITEDYSAGRANDLGLNGVERSRFLQSMVDYYAWHTDSIHSVRSISILSEIF